MAKLNLALVLLVAFCIATPYHYTATNHPVPVLRNTPDGKAISPTNNNPSRVPSPERDAIGWSIVADYPHTGGVYCASGVSDGTYFYWLGGWDMPNQANMVNTMFRYDPATNTWADMSDMPGPNGHMAVTYNPDNNKIYAIGGYTGSAYATSTWEYDIANDAWTTKATILQTYGDWGGEAWAIGDTVYYNMGVYGPDFDAFCISTNTWSNENSPSYWHYGGTGVGYGDYFYRIGGFSDDNNVSRYQFSTGTWTEYYTSLPAGRARAGASAVNGFLYVYGGSSGWWIPEEEVYIYDIANNSWTNGTPMLTPQGSNPTQGGCGRTGPYGEYFDYASGLSSPAEVHEIGSNYTDNIAPTKILAPAGIISAGVTVTPFVRVSNLGTTSHTFDVTLWILGTSYVSTKTVTDLVGGDSIDVQFDDWTSLGGYFTARCSTYTVDQNMPDNVLTSTFLVPTFYKDFELENGMLTPNPAADAWEWGTPNWGPYGAWSGVNVWGTGLNGDYPNGVTWMLTTPYCKVEDAANLVFAFYHWYEMEAYGSYAYDIGFCSYRKGTTAWTEIFPTGGYNQSPGYFPYSGWSGIHDYWEPVLFPLNNLGLANGDSFQLRWYFMTDPYSGTYPGWFIDDFCGYGFKYNVKDVGIKQILAPVGDVPKLPTLQPQVVVKNWGSFTASSVPTYFKIFDQYGTPVYTQANTVTNLLPDSERTVTFATWTQDTGTYSIKTYTAWTQDQNKGNDTMRADIFVFWEDAAPTRVVAPVGGYSPGSKVQPVVVVKNLGSYDEFNIAVTCSVPDLPYSNTQSIIYLAPGDSASVAFDSIDITVGAHSGWFWTVLSTDLNPNNDTLPFAYSGGEIDAELLQITNPSSSILDTLPFAPKAKVKNNSSVVIDIPASFTIKKGLTTAYTGYETAYAVPIGGTPELTFDIWAVTGADTGDFDMEAKSLVVDPIPGNDVKTGTFKIRAGGGLPPGPWVGMANILATPSGKNPKSGSCMAGLNGEVYFLKASGRPDFAKFTPNGSQGNWAQLETLGKGDKAAGDGKYAKKGASMAAYNDMKLFVLRGNNTAGFWKYVVTPTGPEESLGWRKLANIPTGGKNPKDGGGMVAVTRTTPAGDSDYLFVMKGSKTEEFYFYDIVAGTWSAALTAPPTGLSGKTGFKKGSCVTYDPATKNVYVMRGQYGDFYKYNVDSLAWTQLRRYDSKTMLNFDGKKKKFGDGASIVYMNDADAVYALKGGNTYDVWKYQIVPDSGWAQLGPAATWSIPTGGGKKVKGGGGMIMSAGILYAAKGANTAEFYAHSSQSFLAAASPSTPTNNTMGNTIATSNFKLTLAPNPAINLTAVRYTLPKAGPVSFTLYNVAGSAVRTYEHTSPNTDGVVMIDTKALPSGVYILRFNSGAISVTRKLVLQK